MQLVIDVGGDAYRITKDLPTEDLESIKTFIESFFDINLGKCGISQDMMRVGDTIGAHGTGIGRLHDMVNILTSSGLITQCIH